MPQASSNSTPNTSEINIREEIEKYLRYWPWFVLSVFLAMLLAFIYLRYTPSIYHTSASIIIKDENNGGGSELSAMQDLGLIQSMGSNSIENELGILKSRDLMQEVIKSLNLTTAYYAEGNVRTSEIYKSSPLEVEILSAVNFTEAIPPSFQISKPEGNTLKITTLSSGKEFKVKLDEPFEIGTTTMVIRKRKSLKDVDDFKFFPINVVFQNAVGLANSYRSKLQIKLEDPNSSLVEMGMDDPIKEKAVDILSQLIFEYNRQAIEDKNLVARNTAKFIEERLDIISGELDSVESGKQEFKQENKLTDIQSESQLFIENASEFTKKMQEIETQLELIKSMLGYMGQDNGSDLLPSNLGLEANGLNEYIAQFNDLVIQRDRILSGSTPRNPVVVKLNAQIEQLKNNITNSLKTAQSNLRIAKADLNQQSAIVGGKISSVPKKEKEYRGIERQQNIKETLYLFLLQKREENNLSLAVTAPKAKVVDSAFSSGSPVSPNPRSIYLQALLFGLFLPFAVIYSKNLLNNKVESQGDMKNVSKTIPIVGEIPRILKKEQDLVTQNDRSILSESFRILHTNLQYLLVNSDTGTGGNVLFITSTVKGEGKTFTAFNLALTLANAGKKVLIMGADLRNPQLQRYEVDSKNSLGISDYLVNNNLTIADLIKNSTLHSNLDILASGSIPPNPSELWRTGKAQNLFPELKLHYDYIVVDTAPVMLVTDTFLINKFADLTLYVVRAGYTERKLLEFARDAKNDGKLHDVSFVLNEVKLANFGYGNKYGYAYGEEKSGFWNKIKRRV